MTGEQKIVLRKIIYAVETGGQVYGCQDYSDFTEAYTNSSTEYAITIGAGQWYGPEAKTLLERIHKANSTVWDKLDTAGVWEDVRSADWSCYNIAEGSEKAKCIVKLISTTTGIKCQDTLLDEQMEAYAREAEELVVTDPAAQAMCANFRHQGGLSAVKRILAKTDLPYTLDNLYTACQTDTGNQVGAYKSRQKFVYNSLKKYFPEGEDSMGAIEKATKQMESWANGSGLVRGDVLLNHVHHVAMYYGNGKEVEASINEMGSATGGEPGDQTGKEFLIRSYRNYPWDCVLRYTKDSESTGESSVSSSGTTETESDIDPNTTVCAVRINKTTKCYLGAGSSYGQAKLFPQIKKGSLADLTKGSAKDSAGNTWYLVKLAHPTEGFVTEYIQEGTFRYLK